MFFVGFLVVVFTALLWRAIWKRPIDWELIVAFVRQDFPPDQRDVAQQLAALATFVGFRIKELRPEHTLDQIDQWSQGFLAVAVEDLMEIFSVEYPVRW